jgi:hypothetical protein
LTPSSTVYILFIRGNKGKEGDINVFYNNL